VYDLSFKSVPSWAVVAHAFNPSTQEAEAGRFLSSRPAWSAEWVPGQPGLHRKTLSRKTKRKKKKKKKRVCLRFLTLVFCHHQGEMAILWYPIIDMGRDQNSNLEGRFLLVVCCFSIMGMEGEREEKGSYDRIQSLKCIVKKQHWKITENMLLKHKRVGCSFDMQANSLSLAVF
jgi:hypothetical protein